MKKFLLTLALAVVTLCASAAETTVTFGETCGVPKTEPEAASNYTIDGVAFTMNKCKLGVYSKEYYVQISGKNNTGAYLEFTMPDAVSQFKVTTATNGSTNVKVQLSVNGTDVSDPVQLNAKASDFTFEIPEANQAANAKIRLTVTNKYNAQITKMVITTGASSDTRKSAGLSFPQDKYTATLGEAFETPVLTKTTTADVEYSSDAEAVATVDENTGAITLVGEGTARITATAAANDEYKAGSASYLLTVSKAAPSGALYYSKTGEDFNLENPADVAVWSVDTKYGYLKGSAYKGGVKAAVAVAASPVIDLTNCVDANLAFEAAYNQYKLNNVLIDMADFNPEYATVVVREEGATEWTKLADVTLPESFSWTFIENAPVSLKAYAGKKIQFGFRYMSTAEVAGTWEVKEITVTGVTSGIDAIEADTNAPVEYYNLQGVRVANPESGLYIRRQGNKVAKILVK